MRLFAVHLRLLFIVLLSCGFMPWQAQAGSYPLTLKDSLGREVSLATPPQRVVCLLSAVTDLLVELGRTELLVGLSRQDLLNHAGLRVANMGNGQVADLTAFERMCSTMGERLTGTTTLVPVPINTPDLLPPVMARAFGLLVAGVSAGPATSKESQP